MYCFAEYGSDFYYSERSYLVVKRMTQDTARGSRKKRTHALPVTFLCARVDIYSRVILRAPQKWAQGISEVVAYHIFELNQIVNNIF
jgi:hypothetical protein